MPARLIHGGLCVAAVGLSVVSLISGCWPLATLIIHLGRNIAADPELFHGRPWRTLLISWATRWPLSFLVVPTLVAAATGALSMGLVAYLRRVEPDRAGVAIAGRLARAAIIGAFCAGVIVAGMLGYRVYLEYT